MQLASIQLFFCKIHWEQSSYSVQSVFICVKQQWSSVGNTIIHTATRGHWSTGNKHESHWSTNKWRCCIVEEAGDGNAYHQSCFIWFRSFMYSYSAMPENSEWIDQCGTMSPYSCELYIMAAHSKGYIWISLLHHNTLYVCVLHNTRRILIFLNKYMFCRWEWIEKLQPFGIFELSETSEKKWEGRGGIKDMCSATIWTHKFKKIFFSAEPCQSRSLKCIKSTIRLNHLFYWIFHRLLLTQLHRWLCHNPIYF